MMVRGSIPSLIQGISQQSPSIRPTAYTDAGLNVYGTIITGLGTRPGADHRAIIAPLANPAATHWIVRDTGERYFVAADEGTLKVWDFAGVQKTVAAPDSWAYISGASSLAFMTVNDYTFVYDRGKVVAMSDELEPQEDPRAHVWIRQGDYATTYNISVGYPTSSPTWYGASFQTADTNAYNIKLDVIAQGLYGQLVANLPAGFSAAQYRNVIFITRDDGEDFWITSYEDGTAKNLVVVKDVVANPTELPAIALTGTHVRLRGNEANDKDDWWARFVGSNTDASGVFSQGFWRECPEPGTPVAFDASTMPHVLVSEGDGTFTFKEVDWGKRACGGITHNPAPSFVGQKITSMNAMKGRITTTAAGNFVTTRARDPFHFWQRSVQQVSDDDPIDINPSYDKPYTLNGAAEFQKGVLLFADDVQFLVTSGDIFGPKTIGSKPITNFALAPMRGLLGLQQDKVLCAIQRKNHTGIQSFKTPSQSLSDILFDELSAVVPKLIPGAVEWITGTSTENVTAIKASGDDNVYIYKETEDGGRTVQSAWQPWGFKNRKPVSGKFVGADLYVLLKDSAGTFTIESLSFQPLASDQLLWDICLDRRAFRTTGAFTQGVSTTAVTLPWTPRTGENVYLVITEGPQLGAFAKAISVAGNVATFQGLIAGPGVVGVGVPAHGRLSTLYYRRPTKEGGEETVTEGILQITRAKVTFSKSGPFLAQVKPTDRSETFTERVAFPYFEDANYLSPQDLQSGSTEFPVGCINDRVSITFDSGESPMPMRISGFEWKGDLNLQARPL